MSHRPVRAALGRLGRTQIRFVSPVRPSAAPPLVAQVYQQVEQDFGLLAPPIALHAPASASLAACWMMLRETVVVRGLVKREVKEAVATAVSAANACPYCTTVHAATLDVLVHGRRHDGVAPQATDPALAAISAWAQRGGDPGRRAPFPIEHAPELVGVAVVLHYLNRMVNLFLCELPLPPGVPSIALSTTMRVLSRMIRKASLRDHQPGASLDLLPPAALPTDLSWATTNPAVAQAFARAATAFETAGARSATPGVRELLRAELNGWQGKARGISRAWVDEAVRGLPAEERPAGRLVLLTALASHQVDRAIIDDFRRIHPDDRTLIEVTSWASMAAARRIGWRMWLAVKGSSATSHTRTTSVTHRPL